MQKPWLANFSIILFFIEENTFKNMNMNSFGNEIDTRAKGTVMFKIKLKLQSC